MTFTAGTFGRAVGCGIFGCALLAGVGCTRYREVSPMPQVRGISGTVTLSDRGVGLLAGSDKGQPCFELRRAAGVKGAAADMFAYSCLQPQDQLSADLLVTQEHEAPTAGSGPTTPILIVRDRLAVGGVVASSVATVTVNGQPAYRQGPYFLAVLPTIPDGDVTVVGTDHAGKVVVSQQYPRALATTPNTPTSP